MGNVKDIAQALHDGLVSENCYDSNYEPANIVDALYFLARALDRLGHNNADTSMGAVEALSKEVQEGSERIAAALLEVADAVRSTRA